MGIHGPRVIRTKACVVVEEEEEEEGGEMLFSNSNPILRADDEATEFSLDSIDKELWGTSRKCLR